jgi:hypothetical protein
LLYNGPRAPLGSTLERMNAYRESLCRSVDELKDFIAVVVLCAPDTFPSWRHLDLESAFAKLQESTDLCAGELGGPGGVSSIKSNISASLNAYRSGDTVRGAHILQDVMHAL